ncbi:MAG: AAA family ATPase [Vicinamibacterales bacterium]
MQTDDQHEAIAWLSDPATHGGEPVERVTTHAAMVFLAGDRALKMKRAVRYDFMDFSTLDRRRVACEAEVRLNGRVAPRLYRRVLAVTRQPDGRLALGGPGEPVEWVVEMARFDQEGLFDRLAAAGRLTTACMTPLGHAIAALHASAERTPGHGGSPGMSWVIEGNGTSCAETPEDLVDRAACRALLEASRTALAQVAVRLDRRQGEGFVRRCHGDLHLRNIVLLDDVPTLFDAIEFNDEIACVDVFYDLAFLLMDLWRRQLHAHANLVLHAYLEDTGDIDGLALLPLFLSCRAAVRAKTSVVGLSGEADPALRAEGAAIGAEYTALAQRFLRPERPRLVAIGGFSGTGKTSVARALAPGIGAAPGALVVRSDVIRKARHGVAPQVRLGAEAYTPAASRGVYETLGRQVAAVLQTGHTAVADAVFATAEARAAIEAVATALGVPFTGLWLDAPEDTLLARVAARRGDASDADEAVVRSQVQSDPGTLTWARLDAGGALPDLLTRAWAVLARDTHA